MKKSKNSVYLSGSIEASSDPITWRKQMYRALHKHYNVIIPDPMDCPFQKTDDEYPEWVRQNFIMPDMHDVATSRYTFVLLDPAVFKGAGTISEIALACWLGKEIVYMLEGVEKKDMPGWALGCLANAIEVKSIDEAIEYYKKKVKV